MRRKIPLVAGTLMLTAVFAIGGVSAFFTDKIDLSSVLKVKAKTVTEDCIEMSYFNEKNNVGLLPGDGLDMSPSVTNVNNEGCFVFMEVSLPTVNSNGVRKPVFSYEKSGNWHLVKEESEKNSQKAVYCYGRSMPEVLPTKESTGPLFSKVSYENIPGSEEFSGQKVSIIVKATLVKASKIKYEANYKDSKNLYALVLADEKEEISKSYLKENVIGIGKFKVEIQEKPEEPKDEKPTEVPKEPETELPKDEENKDFVVENKGDTKAVIFLKVRALNNPVLKAGVLDLIYLGKDNDEYVFGYTNALDEGESTDNLMDKLEVDGVLETKVVSIQAKNLSKDGVPINTEGKMGKETLKDIYGILSEGMGGFFTDEDEIVTDEHTKGGGFIKIENVFDNQKSLKVGENNYENRIIVKNIGDVPQYVRVKLAYSEEGIEERIYAYTGNGDFVRISDLGNTLNTGWECVEEEGEKYFVYKNMLASKDVTSPLFTHFRVVYEDPEDIKDFDVFIEAEGRKEAFLW